MVGAGSAGSGNDVAAVVVLYQPDGELVRAQFAGTQPQVGRLLYVDNGQGRQVLEQLGLLGRPEVECLGDGENLGIAGAINLALAHLQADASGPRFALLLDQDSVPAPDMIARLLAAHATAAASHRQVAAVGPAIFDTLERRLEGFGQAVDVDRRRPRPEDVASNQPFEVHYLITSGTLLPLKVLPEVGPMEGDLFIDCVDFEWCYRARRQGYRVFGTYGTSLDHRRGERMHRLLPGTRVRLHSPTRQYYIYRNHVRLFFRGYMPLSWKLLRAWRLTWRMALYGALVPGRARYLAAMWRGTRQGLAAGLRDLGSPRPALPPGPPR